jgi:hypothetical protein
MRKVKQLSAALTCSPCFDTHKHTHTHAHNKAYARTYACTHTCTNTHTHTHTHACTHARTHTSQPLPHIATLIYSHIYIRTLQSCKIATFTHLCKLASTLMSTPHPSSRMCTQHVNTHTQSHTHTHTPVQASLYCMSILGRVSTSVDLH